MAKEPKYSAMELPIEKHYSNKPMQLLKYLPDGTEIMDPTPMSPPVGYVRQLSLAEQMRQVYVAQRRAELDALENETIEDADDFEVEDDVILPQTPWENDRDPSIKELIKAGKEALEARARAAKEALAGKSTSAPASPAPPSP